MNFVIIFVLFFCSLTRALTVNNPGLNSIVVDQDQERIAYHQNKTVYDILESRAKIINVTCPELNNFTFDNSPPFDILGEIPTFPARWLWLIFKIVRYALIWR